MKFTVIVPAHNEEQNIRKCLDSIVNQSYKDFELFVVCDSCTDNTVNIAKQYNCTVLEIDAHNEGVGRNTAIENSTGEWILFIDADDWYLHEFVFKQLADRTENNDADAIAYDMVWKHIGVVHPISGRDNLLYPHCTNKCWRRTFIGDTRFPNISPDSDSYFHAEIMKKNPKIDIWDMPLYYYNFLREGSYSDKLGRTAQDAIAWWNIK